MSDASVQVSMPDIVLEPDEVLKFIMAYPAVQQRMKKTFNSTAPAEVRAQIKQDLDWAANYKRGAVTRRFNDTLQAANKLKGKKARQSFLEDHFAQYLGTFDAEQKNELNETVAKHLANGGDLPKKYIQWIAQNILDPNRLKYKKGRPSKHLLHAAICRWIFFLKAVLGYTIKDAQALVSGAYNISESHLRDIWNAPKNQYRNSV
jgi:hypothetical protein